MPKITHSPSSLLALAPLILAATMAAPAPQASAQALTGYTSLFDGKTLSGWRGRPHLDPRKESAMAPEERATQQAKWDADMRTHWKAEGGILINDGHGVFLTTEKEYGDFEFILEYRTVAKADSGIYLRYCPQVQIWDTTEEGGKWKHGADKGSGALWNNQKSGSRPYAHADCAFGEWNHLRILMIGEQVSVWLNHQLVVSHCPLENYFDRSSPVPSKGAIQLQTHGGEIAWRNLFIREINGEEVNRSLMLRGLEKFSSLFDGKTLNGWQGAVKGYEVVDGSIACKRGEGGTLHTKESFSDFEARFEFLLPPGGNNGLAIRYPGKGDTAYVGMCELQILDNSHPKYRNLKNWQRHGSAYGMVPAKVGYLRPPGTWNYEQVKVQGSHITVTLNGTVILDTDLAKVEKPLSGKQHPGRTRTDGHFGFAGHGDPVRYRNIFIRSLKAQ